MEELHGRGIKVGDREFRFDYGMRHEALSVKKIFEYQVSPTHKVFLRKKGTQNWEEWLELIDNNMDGHNVLVVRHIPSSQYIFQRPNVNPDEDDLHLLQSQRPALSELKGWNQDVVIEIFLVECLPKNRKRLI